MCSSWIIDLWLIWKEWSLGLYMLFALGVMLLNVNESFRSGECFGLKLNTKFPFQEPALSCDLGWMPTFISGCSFLSWDLGCMGICIFSLTDYRFLYLIKPFSLLLLYCSFGWQLASICELLIFACCRFMLMLTSDLFNPFLYLEFLWLLNSF